MRKLRAPQTPNLYKHLFYSTKLYNSHKHTSLVFSRTFYASTSNFTQRSIKEQRKQDKLDQQEFDEQNALRNPFKRDDGFLSIVEESLSGKTPTEIIKRSTAEPTKSEVQKIMQDTQDARRFIDILMMPIRSPSVVKEPKISLKRRTKIEEYFSDKLENYANWSNLLKGWGFNKEQKSILEADKYLTETGKGEDPVYQARLFMALAYGNDLDIVEKKYELLKRIQGEDPLPLAIYTSLAYAYANHGKFEEAFALINEIEKVGLKPDVVFFTCLMGRVLDKGKIDKVWEIYDYARIHKGIEPDTLMFTVLITSLAKQRKAEKAFSLFEEMKSLGLFPIERTYLGLLNCCVERVDFADKAFVIFEQMKIAGFYPDKRMYTSLLNVCKRGRKVKLAEKIFAEMKSLRFRDMRAFASMIQVYASDIRYCNSPALKKLDIQRVNELLEEMKSHNIMNVNRQSILGSVITAYAYSCRIKQTEKLWDDYLNVHNHLPNKYLCTVMMWMYAKTKRPESAIAMWQFMKERGINPDGVAYERYVHALIRGNYVKSAMTYLREMRLKGWIPEKGVILMLLQRVREWPDLLREVKMLTKEVHTVENFDKGELMKIRQRMRDKKPINIKLI